MDCQYAIIYTLERRSRLLSSTSTHDKIGPSKKPSCHYSLFIDATDKRTRNPQQPDTTTDGASHTYLLIPSPRHVSQRVERSSTNYSLSISIQLTGWDGWRISNSVSSTNLNDVTVKYLGLRFSLAPSPSNYCEVERSSILTSSTTSSNTF